jgi:hypothetical protein
MSIPNDDADGCRLMPALDVDADAEDDDDD